MPNNPLDEIPHVNFVPKTVDELLNEMIADYEKEYHRVTGTKKSLVPSSEERIFLYTEAARFHTAYQLIDRGCKMNLLKYSEADYLDNLAAWFGLKRSSAKPSVSKVEFQLSAPQVRQIRIAAGTRVSTPDNIYFATIAETVIPAGQTTGEANIESLELGVHTTGILPGQINILVDPIPFVSSVGNLHSTQGGVDIEDDPSFRLRIYYFRDSYSVAGPENTYRYFVRSYSQAVEGISIYSPEPGKVDIRITLTGGELPQQPFIDGLVEYLHDKRPLTDHLTISAPDVIEYTVDCKFYVAQSNRGRQDEIRKQVDIAMAKYIQWQGEEIGRDISPDMLTKLVMEADAKRVPLISPTFTPVNYHSICKITAVNVEFGGVEDD